MSTGKKLLDSLVAEGGMTNYIFVFMVGCLLN